MRTLCTILLLVLVTALGAQTRRIAHRAHSGSSREHYNGRDGNYGDPYPYPTMVKVHLESGRDTLVEMWDTIASPKYLHNIDTTPRAMFYPRDTRPKQDIREMGVITHRLIVKA